jgi:hypothetical protein
MLPLPPCHYAIISPPLFSMPFRLRQIDSILPMPFSPLTPRHYCHFIFIDDAELLPLAFRRFHYWLSILPAFRFSSFCDYAAAIFDAAADTLTIDTLITPPLPLIAARITPLSPAITLICRHLLLMIATPLMPPLR